MRLTLRSLLAYLDDVLEADQAREIGKKIGENREASRMVSRIREVIRRRRIGVPELAGPGSGPDPNLVAEYLENTLSPEEVVEVERLCRESDMHLAEIAACHKILTLFLGQPVDVASEVKERMYVLGTANSVGASSPDAAVTESVRDDAAVVTKHDEMASGVPDYLTRKPLWRNIWLIAGAVVVAAVWLLLLWFDPSMSALQQSQIAQTTATDEGGGIQQTPKQAADRRDERSPRRTSPRSRTEESTTGSLKPPTATPVNPERPVIPEGERAQPRPAPEPEVGVEDAPPLSPVFSEGPMHLAETSGIAILSPQQVSRWEIMPLESGLSVGGEVAAPAPFTATLAFASGCRIRLEPETRMRRIARGEGMDFAIELNRGSVIFSTPESSTEPCTLQMLAGGRSWVITLEEPGTQFGVQYSPPVPQGPPASGAVRLHQGAMGVESGSVSIQSSIDEQPVKLDPSWGWVRWTRPGDPLVSSSTPNPRWMRPDEVLVTSAAKKVAMDYGKEFEPGKTIPQSVAPVVANRIATMSALATRTLSLIDEYRELVVALNSVHEESRKAAIEGLRTWLGRHGDAAEDLHDEVGRVFPDESVAIVMRLLWGYHPTDATNPVISEELIRLLKHDDIAIRELAFYHVSRLANRTHDYRPLDPERQRNTAVGRWENHLNRLGALVEP